MVSMMRDVRSFSLILGGEEPKRGEGRRKHNGGGTAVHGRWKGASSYGRCIHVRTR